MISIIIPTYNRLEKLQRCLESMVCQFVPGTEIIVVDDGSTDGTPQWLQQYAHRHLLKPVTYRENKGVNHARNRGIEAATQPFTMFIDSDDALLPGALQEIHAAIGSQPGFRHYMFLLSCRSAEFAALQASRQVVYADWMSGRVHGDFTHVVTTAVLRSFPFFEEFRMFEQLNWFRVYKATAPQLIFPVVTSQIEMSGTDRLTVSHRLNSRKVIRTKFLSEKKFYDLYHDDLKKYNPAYLQTKLIENILLGVAGGCKQENKALLAYARQRRIRWTGRAINLLPSGLMGSMIIRFSKLKGRLKYAS